MKLRNLALVLLSLGALADVFAAAVRPVIETTIKGANGTEAKFTVMAVWADGFHVRQPAGKPPLFITWDKVDVAWLETERPDLQKRKAAAKPFPVLTPEQAEEKLAAAKKLFRAPKTLTTEDTTAPNVMAEAYASKVRSLTTANLTQGINQIIADVKTDLGKLKDATGGTDIRQRTWLTGSFTTFLRQLEKVQREIDPVCAGDVNLPKGTDPFGTGKTKNDDWF